MAVSTQTMTDEQRKSVALEYLRAFDHGGVTSDGGNILDLFADDAQVYFPKWGIATGRDQIGRLFGPVSFGIFHRLLVKPAILLPRIQQCLRGEFRGRRKGPRFVQDAVDV